MALSIEKGLAMPKISKESLTTVVKQMEVGDSVLCDSKTQAASLAQAGYVLGFGFRKFNVLDGAGSKTEKYRVWRTK